MKKYTVKEFADRLRKTHPGQLDDLDDFTLTYRWVKKYPDSRKYLDWTDAAKAGIVLSKDNVVNWFKKQKEKVQDKITPSPQPTDTTTQPSDTTTQNDGNWMGDVIDRIKQAKEKLKSNTQPQQQPSNTPAPEQKKVAPAYSSTFKSKPCDENTFPWTRGCMNNKIGQMNQIYFGDRYGNIYGDDLYYQLRSLGYFAAQGQKDGEITQYIYDGVLKDSLQESDNFERKKIVKETVKNVLKERLKTK